MPFPPGGVTGKLSHRCPKSGPCAIERAEAVRRAKLRARMDESSAGRSGLTRALDSRLPDAGADPYALLADLLGGADVAADSEVLALHGRTLDGVRLGRILGTGGMGVTYAGVDADGADVAVKVLGRLGELEQARFEHECSIVQALNHPHIARYRRHGITPGGTPYLVMELVDGADLDALLGAIERGEPLDAASDALLADLEPGTPPYAQPIFRRRLLTLLAAVADALGFAHQAGIVHRDVKPANVVVGPSLRPVLVDFGLARDLFQDASWTRSGAAVGTVGWMAPEQLEGESAAVGPRTDVFALGLLLHRALTGRELRRDLRDLLRFRRGRLVLEKEDTAGLDDGVVAVLYGCLEPRPEHRYSSAEELAADLRALAAGRRPARRAPGWIGRTLRRRRVRVAGRWGIAAAVVALAVALWPKTALVTITALEDDQNGVVWYADGRPFLTGPRLPVFDLPVPYGVYDLEYRSRRIGPLAFRLVADRRHVRLDLLNVPRGESQRLAPEGVLYEGADFALLDVATSIEGAHLQVDGRSVEWAMSRQRGSSTGETGAAHRSRLALAPGTHVVKVFAEDGASESQEVVLLPGRYVPVVLLGAHLGEVPGAFRATWASVLVPPPGGVQLVLGANAGTCLDALGLASPTEGELDQDQLGWVHNRRNTCITGLLDTADATALLTVRLPSPARSLVAVFNAGRHTPADSLEVEWRLDEGDWSSLVVPAISGIPTRLDDAGKEVPTEQQAIRVSGLAEPGARELQIRFRMRPRQRPGDTTTVSVLQAYVNDVGLERIDAAFSIVADPDPTPRRRQ